MKKMLLSLAVSSVLVGCGGGETLEDVKKDSTPVLPLASVKFDPSNSVISVPNDLLLNGTKDGTLNFPGELDENGNAALARANYASPSLSLGALDGWSTQMPYVINLDVPSGYAISEQSASDPTAVRIFEVVMGADQSDEQCKQVPAGIACRVVGELTNGLTGDFVSALNGSKNGIAIQPLKPFKAGKTYITVLTDSLKMSDGRAVQSSSTYTLLRQEAPLVTDTQLALQAVIKSYENAVTSEGALSKENIIYTAAATMQSVGQVVGTIKKLMAGSLATGSNPKLVLPEQPMMTVSDALAAVIPDPATRAPFQAVQYMRGSIQLPMYSSKPATKEISSAADTYWRAQCDSAVMVQGYKAAIGGTLPAPQADTNDAACAAMSGGVLRDFGLDSTRFLTKYNTIPQVQWLANVPVQVTKPIPQLLGIEMPATGWPVVILQHGITTTKEAMLGLTLALSSQGFATVAIDHPMHGERGLDIDGDGIDDFNATDGKGSVLSYMNLTSLLAARDNLRQSSVDLLGLRLGLNFVNPAMGLNPTQVSFVGHSLGSVVAPSFIAHANLPLDPQVDPLFKVQSAALASGGSGIASFLAESEEFGPFVQGSVLLAANNLATKAFVTFIATDAASQCSVPDGIEVNPQNPVYLSAVAPCAFTHYVAHLSSTGDTQSLAEIKGIIQQFVFAAQTALDSGDPLNYASLVQAVQTPIYMSVVTGGVDGNKADTVIAPTTTNPLSGSTPLARMMGLQTVSETQTSQTPMSYVVNFSQGNHGSVVTTSFRENAGGTAQGHAMAAVEMQTQIVSFLKSQGLYLQITNPAVIAN
ncbi:Lysophospholipase VolA [Pseudoalteromonas holothuriae]|uniref:Lysophospholipase VolA n=1 Tax=Pseudoalteromonas holothuriae TaxID=2963714 RepID=A0A9W4QYY8_9GAMM|nr:MULTISPECIES: VolA/Pla-1 family phospholipase [unclassified Pseudoalteromonas]CAH9059022.1 Lysophospholipase VolA [Pseudoalteromonas sp. CIP111854]CAH9068296.1 Lysophospholipase VolA [Pseudoalteromonas sp. CIP111951]